MDVQYILTGVRSNNLFKVTEETETPFRTEKREGAGALSREEEVLVRKYRQLPPKKRTHAQAVVDALGFNGRKKEKNRG